MKDFGRVLTAMITPFKKDLSVDYDATVKFANYLVENGSDALVVAGTTGEAATMTETERLKLFEVVMDAVGDKAVIIGGTGSNNTAATVEFSKAAAKLGLHGLLISAPYYNKPTQAGIYKHFAAAAEAVDTPIIVYNVPGRTGVNILPQTVLDLAKIDNIAAVKEASGSLDQMVQIAREMPKDFYLYSGDDGLTLPALAIGGYGIISVASNVAGNQIKAMINAYLAGKIEEAKEINYKLHPLFKALFVVSNPIPVKAAVSLLGLSNPNVRLPLVEAEPAEVEKVREAMTALGLIG